MNLEQPSSVPLLQRLLVAARLWSSGRSQDLPDVARLRRQALLANHAHYLTHIPAYAELADDLGLGTAGTDENTARPDDLPERMLVTDAWFKSFDQDWLRPGPAGDLAALTGWLGTMSTVVASSPDVDDLAGWRAGLRDQRVYVTFSSGTTGTPSVVPRDRLTLAALRSCCGVRLPWSLPARGYDCLLLTRAGMGQGIQSGAAGLAATARRVHRLPPGDDDVLDAARFLRASAAAECPVLVYGPPAGLARLLDGLDGPDGSGEDHPALPPGSCVVTGGGWKADLPGDLPTLLDRAGTLLGVPADRCVDGYSAAELNIVFVSCPHGRYHVPPVVEAVVVDELLSPVDDPEPEGRLAVLDPFACCYPGFLATSDRVRLRADPCPCGLPGQTLLGPIGRMPGALPRGCGVVEEALL